MKNLSLLLLVFFFSCATLYSWDGVDSYGERVIFICCEKITLDTARDVNNKLLAFDRESNSKRSLLILSSFGGHGGQVVANYLKLMKSPVDVVIIGNCSSGATMLAAAATGRRYILPDLTVGVHIPMHPQSGRGQEQKNSKTRLI